MDTTRSKEFFDRIRRESPRAFANIRGSEEYPDLRGLVVFFRADRGSFVFVELINLPVDGTACGQEFFGFHIHEGNQCTGNAEDPFADTGLHLNPDGCMHPRHMGDLPPVMAAKDGYAWMVFFTDQFSPEEVQGRTIVIHRMPDDFTSQPSGNSGTKIGCGEIH